MGVSIGWYPVDPDPRDITPGWRSMMHQLLLDNGLYGALDADDIPLLLKLGREQHKGNKAPPFDYAEDVHKSFKALVRAIRKHGTIIVVFEH